VSITVKQNKVGVTNMDKYLSDYIKRTTERLEKQKPLEEPKENLNDYKVWPEEQGDADHKRNPYSSV
jgi:hypothetical protein